jgi:hypothetical protein
VCAFCCVHFQIIYSSWYVYFCVWFLYQFTSCLNSVCAFCTLACLWQVCSSLAVVYFVHNTLFFYFYVFMLCSMHHLLPNLISPTLLSLSLSLSLSVDTNNTSLTPRPVVPTSALLTQSCLLFSKTSTTVSLMDLNLLRPR